MLQETMLISERLGDLNSIDENYESVGVGATFSERSLQSMAGRPRGGMACLWRTDGDFKINKIVLDEDMILMSLTYMGYDIVLVNVYFHSDLWKINTLNNY